MIDDGTSVQERETEQDLIESVNFNGSDIVINGSVQLSVQPTVSLLIKIERDPDEVSDSSSKLKKKKQYQLTSSHALRESVRSGLPVSSRKRTMQASSSQSRPSQRPRLENAQSIPAKAARDDIVSILGEREAIWSDWDLEDEQVTPEEFDQFEKAEAREAIGGKADHNRVWQTSVNEKLEIARLLNERKRLMENPTIDSTYQDQVKANDTALANFDRYVVDRVVARLPSSFHDVMSDSSTWSQPIHRELRHADKQLDDLEESNFLSM